MPKANGAPSGWGSSRRVCEYAWLRAERRYVIPSRPVLTDLGRRTLAIDALFGPWPTVAETIG